MFDDGLYEEKSKDDSSDVVHALTASGEVDLVNPPKEFFENPNLVQLSPLTVTAAGRIYGHIAPWNVSHIGLPPGTTAPHSRHDYAFFKTGAVETAEGSEVHVGQLTLAGGHAPVHGVTAGKAVQHYDDTASAVADVNVGEDAHGIWVSGALRPGVTPEEVRALRASAPSGDWRPINGNLELVAVCQVNVPGFPVARAMVAGGEMLALVAAGASTMYELRQQETINSIVASMEDRITKLEDKLGVVASVEPVGNTQLDDSSDGKVQIGKVSVDIPVYADTSVLNKS